MKSKLLKIMVLLILTGNIIKAEYFAIKDDFTKDSKNVYYFGEKVERLSPEGFIILNNYVVKDKKNVFNIYTRRKIKNVDVNSFELVDNNYFKDKNNVYFQYEENFEKIENADSKTFEVIKDYFAKDRNNVYYFGKKLDNMKSNSFKIIKVFFDNYIIQNSKDDYYLAIDIFKRESFRDDKLELKNINNLKIDFATLDDFIGGKFLKDKNNVYYVDDNGMRVLNDADVKTFERFQQEYTFYKDKNNIYYEDKKLEGVDRKTFESTSLFGKDKSNIYYKNKKLGLTSKNFQIISDIENIFKNAEGIYLINDEDVKETGAENIKIVPMESKNVDLKTFENLSTPIFSINYYKDKNNIYYKDENKFIKVENVDMESFKVIDNDNAEDKNRKYFKGK